MADKVVDKAGSHGPHEEKAPPKSDEKLTGKEALRKASEILHSAVEPIPPVLIADVLSTLKAAVEAGPAKEPPPKNLDEAVSKVQELVGKIDPPLEHKPDFKAVLDAAHAPPPPKVEAVVASDTPGEAKAS